MDAQRDAQRERAPRQVAQRESRDRQPTVVVQVPLVLEASYELYSDACGYSQRYNERVSMCQYKHTRFRHECIWFLNAVLAAFAIYLCVGLQQAHRRTTVLRAAESKHC